MLMMVNYKYIFGNCGKNQLIKTIFNQKYLYCFLQKRCLENN